MTEKEAIDGLPSDAGGHHPPILSHGLINTALRTIEIASLVWAGYNASRGTGQFTLAQSLLLPMLAVLPYRRITGARREYQWGGYERLGWDMLDVVGGVVIGALVILVYSWVFRPHGTIGDWLVRWTLSAISGVLAVRLVFRLWVRQLYRQGKLIHRVAVIGAGPEAERVLTNLLSERYKSRNYEIVGIFDERFPDRRPEVMFGLPVQQGLDPLLALAQSMPIDTIIVSWPVSASRRIAMTMEMVRSIPADILVLLDFEWLISSHMRIRTLESAWYLQVAHRPLIGTRALIKAVEDYVVATIGIILTSPIMLMTAFLIWREGDGPVFFKQRRIGFNNIEFEMLKFRSMTVATESKSGTLKDDPRVTRIGKFIRRTSIDELPQLFNVLRGEMSIVGPRAHVPDMLIGDHTYREIVAKYAARHRVKPGITGWGQINGMRGGIRDESKARRGVELDLDYIDNWSVWLDVVIMIRTVFGGLWGSQVF
jgi:putative colanic acid biosynthesis UDP-glucose lipid carrier transferase